MGLNPGILLKALAEGLSVKLSWASSTKPGFSLVSQLSSLKGIHCFLCRTAFFYVVENIF